MMDTEKRQAALSSWNALAYFNQCNEEGIKPANIENIDLYNVGEMESRRIQGKQKTSYDLFSLPETTKASTPMPRTKVLGLEEMLSQISPEITVKTIDAITNYAAVPQTHREDVYKNTYVECVADYLNLSQAFKNSLSNIPKALLEETYRGIENVKNTLPSEFIKEVMLLPSWNRFYFFTGLSENPEKSFQSMDCKKDLNDLMIKYMYKGVCLLREVHASNEVKDRLKGPLNLLPNTEEIEQAYKEIQTQKRV